MSRTFYTACAIVCLPTWVVYRMRATGTEHVPETGGFLLASNHVHNLDPLPLSMTLFPKRHLRFMAKSELYVPPMSWFLKGVEAFPVRRDARDLAALDNAVRLCQEGKAVAVFPEGTRRPKDAPRTYVGRAHSGSARIALAAGVPIVPAAITGTDRLARLGPLRVAYGPPIPAEGRPKQLTERMMSDIAGLLETLVAENP